MTRRHAAVTLLTLLAGLPACVTQAAYDALAKPIHTEERAASVVAITRVLGASIASLGSGLSLVVEVERHDGSKAFFEGRLSAVGTEHGEAVLVPADLDALPPSIAPIVYTAWPGSSYSDVPAHLWLETQGSRDPAVLGGAAAPILERGDLEQAPLVSIWRNWGELRVRVCLAVEPGRLLHQTPAGLVRQQKELAEAVYTLEVPDQGGGIHAEDHERPLGTLAFAGLAPFTLILDLAIVTAAVVFFPITIAVLLNRM